MSEDYDLAINYYDEDYEGFQEFVSSFGDAQDLRVRLESEWDLVLTDDEAFEIWSLEY